MQQNSLANLVSSIKFSLLHKKFIAPVPYSRLNIQILTLLYNEGYIRGFKVIELTNNTKSILIYLKLAFRSSILDICFFPKRNKFSYIKYNQLISLYGLKTFG